MKERFQSERAENDVFKKMQQQLNGPPVLAVANKMNERTRILTFRRKKERKNPQQREGGRVRTW